MHLIHVNGWLISSFWFDQWFKYDFFTLRSFLVLFVVILLGITSVLTAKEVYVICDNLWKRSQFDFEVFYIVALLHWEVLLTLCMLFYLRMKDFLNCCCRTTDGFPVFNNWFDCYTILAGQMRRNVPPRCNPTNEIVFILVLRSFRDGCMCVLGQLLFS